MFIFARVLRKTGLAMDLQEECGSTKAIHVPNDPMSVDVGISSGTANQSKETASTVYEPAIKVRKPYTITKQREKWTEEEHAKFLEALKLYGRAWRQIEEHIGTKSAVQIRSHAQKFFSKVTRESAGHGAESVKAIEIPPPRPKRKPMHPYPRKFGHSPSMKIPERSSVPIPSTSEQDNGSPTTVLTVFPSDIESASGQENRSPTSILTASSSDKMRSSDFNLPSGCTSPVSLMGGSNQFETFPSDRYSRCQKPEASEEEENRSLLPVSASTGFTTEEKSDMELNLKVEVDPTIDAIELQATSLKLFGKTVIVTDFQKQSSSRVGSTVQCPKLPQTNDIESRGSSMDIDLPQSFQLDMQKQVQSVLENTASGWSLTPGRMTPMFFCLPSHGDTVNASAGSAGIPFSWQLASSGSSPVQFTNVQSTNPKQDKCQSSGGSTGVEVIQQEDSQSGSNTASISEVPDSENAGHFCQQTSSSSLRPSLNSAFSSINTSTVKLARGFVPYRRCAAEAEVHTTMMADEVGDSEHIKLCLRS